MKRNHVLITGTGRAGTTFLVHLLTKIGVDTGFDLDNIDKFIDPSSFGGLESDIRNNDAPYVVKSPTLSFSLDEIFQNEDIVIDAVIVPFRPIKDATASRLAVQHKTGHFLPNSTAGGITTGAGGLDQEDELRVRIERMLYSIAHAHVPVVFIAYPLLMNDKEYLYQKMVQVFTDIQFERFSDAFDSIYVPGRVHEFDSHTAGDLQGHESEWNHNFLSQMIQQDILSKEKINHLEILIAQLSNDLNQVMQSRSVRLTQPLRSLAKYFRKFSRSK